MKRNQQLAIIGAGPAGITAAIYAKRSNIDVVVFTSEVIGGKAAKTLIIENYPGTKNMTGDQFCQKLKAQVEYLKIRIKYEKVISIKQNKAGFFLLSTDKNDYLFEKVILATGTKERKLPIKNALTLEGRGISYCSSCDGYFFKNKIIAVVGGGNSAVEESKVLAQIGKKIIILNRNQQLRAEKMLIDEIQATKNISLMNNVEIKAINGKEKLTDLLIWDKEKKEEKKLLVDGLFVYIGALPNSNFLKFKEILLDNDDYIIVKKNFMTEINHLYAIGDVVSGHIQQYTTAIGSATSAMIDIIKKGFKK